MHTGCFHSFVLDKGHPQPLRDQKVLWPHETYQDSKCLLMHQVEMVAVDHRL